MTLVGNVNTTGRLKHLRLSADSISSGLLTKLRDLTLSADLTGTIPSEMYVSRFPPYCNIASPVALLLWLPYGSRG
jgi:hypothetical protein